LGELFDEIAGKNINMVEFAIQKKGFIGEMEWLGELF
jgi:hypothetical protein